MQCSADANAKNLHGKERRIFRSNCIKEHTAKLHQHGVKHVAQPAQHYSKPAQKTASKAAQVVHKKKTSNPS